MFLKIILPLFFVSFLIGCSKADPEAYRIDPILQDYKGQLAATTADAEGLKKQIEGVKKDIATSVPQTGQARLHIQKLNDLESRLRNLEQQIRFWKIRIETRAKEAQKEYLQAYSKKEPWPDPAKTEAYFAEKRLRQAKMKWDQKDRIAESKKSGADPHKAPPAGH